MIARLALAGALLAGCFDRGTVVCADGRVCPADTTCDVERRLCLSRDQLASCVAQVDGTSCTIEGRPIGVCRDELCLRPTCGDGLAEGLEACDGDDLRGRDDCLQLGFHDPGPIACLSDCTWDTAACARLCGDGIADPEEDCDAAPGSVVADCRDEGFYDVGPVRCASGCTHDTSACTGSCGDGAVNGPELCDGAAPPGACIDYGFEYGPLTCSTSCAPELARCGTIGWTADSVGLDVVTAIAGTSSMDLWFGGTIDGKWRLVHVVAGVPSVFDPGVSEIRDLAVTSGTVFVAAGPRGVTRVVGGTNLESQLFDASTLWVASATEAFAGGAEGIHRFDGTAWAPLPEQPPNGEVFELAGHGTTLYALTDQIWRREGAGPWTLVPGPGTSPVYYDIAVAPATGELFAGADVGAARFANGAWTVWSDGAGLELATAAGEAFALDHAGDVVRWDGTTWRRFGQREASTLQVTRIWAGGDRVVVAGVWVGHATADWARERVAFASVAWTSGDDQLVATTTGVSLHATSWSSLLATSAPVTALWALDRDTLWAIANNELITPLAAHAIPGAGLEVWSDTADAAWVVGSIDNNATIWRHDVTGWTIAHQRTGAGSFSSVHGGNGAIWAVGTNGIAARFDGTSWQHLPFAGGELYSVQSLGIDEAIALAGGGRIVRWRLGQWFVEHTAPVDLYDLWASGPDEAFAVGASGLALHFDGAGWAPIAVGTTRGLSSVAAREDLVMFVEAASSGTIVHTVSRLAPW